jgi:hypothetical protein
VRGDLAPAGQFVRSPGLGAIPFGHVVARKRRSSKKAACDEKRFSVTQRRPHAFGTRGPRCKSRTLSHARAQVTASPVVGRGIDPRTSRFQIRMQGKWILAPDPSFQAKGQVDWIILVRWWSFLHHADSPCSAFVWARCGHEA